MALLDATTNTTITTLRYPEHDYSVISKQHGWAEQHPDMWWQDLCHATKLLIQETQISPRDIGGIGITYQMHGLVLVDRDHKALRPAIIWSDGRAVNIGKRAFHDMGELFCLENLLNSPGNFTTSRLKWIKDNEPHIYERTYKFMLPGDYIAMKMTGEICSTVSGISEAILWDFQKQKVSQEILNYFELDKELVPDLQPTFSIQGNLTHQAAYQTGLHPNTPFTYRAGDQPNNALALNVMRPGEIAASSAESGVVYGIVDTPKYDPKSRVNSFAHVNYEEQNGIGVLLCLNGAGKQYNWLKHQIAVSGRNYEDMERIASTIPVGSDGLCVLPFGNGAERILEDRNINSHILNLDFNRHTRGHVFRAALEGVAFSFVHGVNVLKEMNIDVDIIRVGNEDMFRSEVFAMTLATMLDCQVEQVDTNGAIGAARGAGIACGAYKNLEEALRSIKPKAIYEPRLNYMMCNQAYNYWYSNLEKILYELPNQSSRPERLKQINFNLKKEIEKRDQDLATVSLKLNEKDELLEDIKNRLARIGSSENTAHDIRRLIMSIDQQTDKQKDWQHFQEKFDIIHSDFFKKLKKKHPKLSPSDAKLCSLIKLNLTTKEMANQLNLSVRGVETRRYRLRKKFDLSKSLSLDEYLETI
ncbi:FGGY family carbohydrate kinase [Reichenbachiella versicolor]|uniref:FGGY family carbohydrate kinase n=1 Tax=Reichenbachiella versicolor TaxID=1821036 RepID=UPI001C886ABE|nr:FGGY family carbohydrate kinase [Reichenbachiella versicolor]